MTKLEPDPILTEDLTQVTGGTWRDPDPDDEPFPRRPGPRFPFPDGCPGRRFPPGGSTGPTFPWPCKRDDLV